MLMDPHSSKQLKVGLQHAVFQMQQEVTRQEARLQPV